MLERVHDYGQRSLFSQRRDVPEWEAEWFNFLAPSVLPRPELRFHRVKMCAAAAGTVGSLAVEFRVEAWGWITNRCPGLNMSTAGYFRLNISFQPFDPVVRVYVCSVFRSGIQPCHLFSLCDTLNVFLSSMSLLLNCFSIKKVQL